MKPKPVKARSILFAEILLRDRRLKTTHRMILGYISSFDQCFASNAHIASFAGCGVVTVSRTIKDLKFYGYIIKNEVFEKNGRRTYLRTVIPALKIKPVTEKFSHKTLSKSAKPISKTYMRYKRPHEEF